MLDDDDDDDDEGGDDLLLQPPQKGLCVAYATAIVLVGVVWQLRPDRPYKQATTDLA